MKIEGKQKLSITEVEVANKTIIRDVAAITKVPEKQVLEIMDFIGAFTASVIRKGEMQGVMLPGFGKFKPRPKVLRALEKKRQLRDSGMMEVVKAVITKNKPDETL